MSRWTARLLVYFFLWVSIGPAAMAASAPQAHACCVRKKLKQPSHQHHHHDSMAQQEDTVSSTHCEQGHRCCSPLTVSHFAQTRATVSHVGASSTEIVRTTASNLYHPEPMASRAPARAPPSSLFS
jgi:hypothetical protein